MVNGCALEMNDFDVSFFGDSKIAFVHNGAKSYELHCKHARKEKPIMPCYLQATVFSVLARF